MNKTQRHTRIAVYGLLALLLWAASLMRYSHGVSTAAYVAEKSASKQNPTQKSHEQTIDVATSHEAVMSVLQVDLSQEYTIAQPVFYCLAKPAIFTCKSLSAKPLSSYFRKLFANAIATNAP
ncbi:hypothetical protein SAMN05421780_10440 [Flexibacter flexilis DSM 6793]|uniref:Uncharacterized protein n=1 Tax=Flexibacter flexilis DSM 6793 TaxID=927664 RepID=A0A1I1HUQ1_9BACT|nr:hypothetical protein [Flexibacter flexilis]SFC25678.1 hypothetical protein SAMN05421780_10440 [Flexibacter flexilis DSM 6793]